MTSQSMYEIGIAGRLNRPEMPVNPIRSVTAMTATVEIVSWTDALSLTNGNMGVRIVWMTIVCEITPNMNQPHWKYPAMSGLLYPKTNHRTRKQITSRTVLNNPKITMKLLIPLKSHFFGFSM